MSRYDFEYMRKNFRVGFADTLGDPWWGMYGDVSDVTYPGAIPMEDANKFLGWKPVKVELPYKKAWGETPVMIINEETQDLVGIMGEDYPETSHKERMLDGLVAILDDSELNIGSMLMLDGGSKATVQITLGDVTNIGEDTFRLWIAAATSLDGTLRTTFKKGATRIQCDNTFDMFMREGGAQYSYKNTKDSKLEIATAREALDIFTDMESELTLIWNELTNESFREDQWNQLLEVRYPTEDKEAAALTKAENTRVAISEIYFSDSRVSNFNGTQWGAFQAFSTFNQHESLIHDGENDIQRNARRALKGDMKKFDASVLNDIKLVAAGA